jgi:5-methylcytosine-specific restriction endonuclease McrA
MGVIHNIFKDMKREKIIQHYSDKNRWIAPELYKKLKAKKKCMRCKKKFSGRIPEIHHIVPVSKGGQSTEDNLMALCIKCHDIMDAAEGVGDKR